MTATVATMTAPFPTYAHAQVSLPDLSAVHVPSDLALRRGYSARPPFLHRTPFFQSRASASMSQLAHVRPLPLPNPTSAPTHALERASAPVGVRSASESAMGRVRMLPDPLMHVRTTFDHSPLAASTLPPTDTWIPNFAPRSQVYRFPPLPLPPPVDKALPPVPFPTGPPTPTEEPLDPEFRFLPSIPQIPVHVRSMRPVSDDAEKMIRELEQIAASVKGLCPSPGVSSSSERYDVELARQSASLPKLSDSDAAGKGADLSASTTTIPATSVEPLKANLSVPHILLTDLSTEKTLQGSNSGEVHPPLSPISPVSSVRKAVLASEEVAVDETEEVLWMDEYGAWGTSEKGKWKAIVVEADEAVQEQDTEVRPPLRTSMDQSYIYEVMGAPEFLIGSSTSRTARAARGYRSRRPSKRNTFVSRSSTGPRIRRKRPAPLVLANPAQADWDKDATLASALLLGTPVRSRRPKTAPHNVTSNNYGGRTRQPTPPSAWLTSKQPHQPDGNEVPPPTHAEEREAAPNASADVDADVREVGAGERRSEPLPAMPRMPAPTSTHPMHVLRSRLEQEQTRQVQVSSWASSVGSSINSEPNTPRPSPRPRLKSLKGLFKHWSK